MIKFCREVKDANVMCKTCRVRAAGHAPLFDLSFGKYCAACCPECSPQPHATASAAKPKPAEKKPVDTSYGPPAGSNDPWYRDERRVGPAGQDDRDRFIPRRHWFRNWGRGNR